MIRSFGGRPLPLLLVLAACVVGDEPVVEPEPVVESPTLDSPAAEDDVAWGSGRGLQQGYIAKDTTTLAFEDVSHQAGITYAGRSYGVGFGDFDGDGWPDIWAGNHAETPFLYLNQRDGTFREVALSVMGPTQKYDAHGLVWADLDNDGDVDLLESVGAQSGNGVGANRVHLNDGGYLVESASELGLTYSQGSGRCPLVYDWNLDGRLDVVWNNQRRGDGLAPTALFTQGESGDFSHLADVPADVQHPTGLCGQLADVDGDRVMEVVRFGRPASLTAHDSRSPIFEDISERVGMPVSSQAHDVVVADFNGDLRNDILISRWREASDWLADPSGQRLLMALRLDRREQGVAFTAEEDVTIKLDPPWFWSAEDIRVGASCVRVSDMSLTFAADALEAEGHCPHEPGVDHGLYIGREDGIWRVVLSAGGWKRGNIEITSTGALDNLDWVNLEPLSEADYASQHRDWLWFGRDGGGFDERGWGAGLREPTKCSSVVSGDFDNDMDLDLFMVCARPVENTENLLYRNDDGVFTLVEDFGASGTTAGRGDTVVTADYDRDGFLDLFVTNGLGSPPLDEGPHELFHNVGNDNHWLEIDLVGTLSNRQGFGASVLVTAGGVTQLREQNGGTHHMGQNHTRLHVGLGQNEVVERIEVIWPDGNSQVLETVDVDQVLEIVEPS